MTRKLGRIPSKPDSNDFKLEWFFGDTDPLVPLLARLVASRSVAKATKAWAKAVTARLVAPAPGPAPTPTPPPAPTPTPPNVVEWQDPRDVLDQGDTPHCVGFGWAQFGNTSPVNDSFANADGDKLYYDAKVIDGEPGAEDGSDVRSGAKAMQQIGRLNAYAFASSFATAKAWVEKNGPVVLGTDWTDDMFDPDENGVIHATGQVAGGHCYLWVGVDEAKQQAEILNSWGASWGVNGRAFIPLAELEQLYASNGEACTAVELPL